ncbi:MAG TPA: hypothetical protein VMP12_06465 [Candidatus Sulfotelmatobacter sp.]|nr:hypothetical protein [Candidatus Sulfotelmatobacter sp.]
MEWFEGVARSVLGKFHLGRFRFGNLGAAARCYIDAMYSQKFQVDVTIRGERRACPVEWLDQFCMRNFTNSADFDDTLPVGEGRVEASFRVTPERFAQGLGAWLTQRGKGEGQAVGVEVTRI